MDSNADERADDVVSRMSPEEKVMLTHGILAVPIGGVSGGIPPGAVLGAGFVPGIPRLGIPNLTETDASLGVSYVKGLRNDASTALPSALSMASSWNPDLVRRGGEIIGAEAHAKGFNVLLGGGVNLMRDPRNGRTFEYYSEDPLLSAVLAGHAIAGVQSNHVMCTIKHLALNGQETGRKFADVKISDANARESDLLAFEMGIEIGQPGAVMGAYNRVNGEQACASHYLMNDVLKGSWQYKGFVMSDWGAVPGPEAALAGLDQQSGEQLDGGVYFGAMLAELARSDARYAARIDDMNRRILRSIYACGLDTHPAKPGGEVDYEGHAQVAETLAAQGIVLLRNRKNTLPLSGDVKTLLVVGGHADTGVLSGGGSSQVHGAGGPALNLPIGGSGPFASFITEQYHQSVPIEAIRQRVPNAEVRFRSGYYPSEAAAQAARAEAVIVFANVWCAEGVDLPDLTLPRGQDELIRAITAVNPNTIVVLQTGAPVLMPWLEGTAAVVQAWYPGCRGAEAIAAVLFGDVNPSGRLPISFPASESDLPRPRVDGFDKFEPNLGGDAPNKEAELRVDYDIEGSDVGYRWFAREGIAPLFPFGFGLSYTTFSGTELRINELEATFLITNTGSRAGATVGQLYLVKRAGVAKRRLVGFERVELEPGESRRVALNIDPRLLADWSGPGWEMPTGEYTFALGDDAVALGELATAEYSGRRWES